jgi:hypothetical protein
MKNTFLRTNPTPPDQLPESPAIMSVFRSATSGAAPQGAKKKRPGNCARPLGLLIWCA